MAGVFAKCKNVLEAQELRRSSQIVSVINKQVYIFGGELRPREPRDNESHVIALHGEPTLSTKATTQLCPSPRVGTASATVNGKIYLFSGRGGVAMTPIEESGSVSEFDPAAATWTLISPINTDAGSYPVARSYHCMTSDGKDTLYLHAGCPETGRLSDLWAFNLSERKWTELSSAPAPPRGGTSVTFLGGALYRMNGFDGKTEQGGSLDIYSVQTNTWTSHTYVPDGISGPTSRSVSSLLPVTISGKASLVTMFGERDPSSLGHKGAGKMLDDVWVFDIESKTWSGVELQGNMLPAARGWFDADVIDGDTVVIQGGLAESNERLGDIWTLHLQRRAERQGYNNCSSGSRLS